ncbi:hypothetical protein JCM3775_001031 [Rhodotorula graminis]
MASPAQQPVAGPSCTRTLDLAALATPPPHLLHSHDVRAFFVAALDGTGAPIDELQPQLDELVDMISKHLIVASRGKRTSIAHWLLGLEEVVSARLTGRALEVWTRRVSEAGGDAVDSGDDYQGVGDGVKSAASTSAGAPPVARGAVISALLPSTAVAAAAKHAPDPQ